MRRGVCLFAVGCGVALGLAACPPEVVRPTPNDAGAEDATADTAPPPPCEPGTAVCSADDICPSADFCGDSYACTNDKDAAARACEPRRVNGAPCERDAHCCSNRCLDKVCAPGDVCYCGCADAG